MRYDLIVIGSGPAGEKGAAQAAYFGKNVALVEKAQFPGGAAVNTGTLPSKTLRETALYLSGFRQRGLHGVDVKLGRTAELPELLFHEQRVMEGERSRIDDNLSRHQVARFDGHARFLSPNSVHVSSPAGEQVLEADHILVATGSAPYRPPEFPFDDVRVYDSDEMVRVHMIPHSMAVVGGGVIGCEYACLFAALGVQVTLVEPKSAVMTFLDGELSELLQAEMQRLGVRLRLGERVTGVTVTKDSARLSLSGGEPWTGDIVLVAAGRQAATDELDLAKAGLTAGKRGALEVDANFRTKVPSIWAAGDVIGFPALASTAMEQARIAVVHMFDLKYKQALAPVLPYGIYTIPEVSMAGETEASLTEKKIPYVVGRAKLGENARGRIIGEHHGMLKLLASKADGKLLGVHLIGEGATELIHVGLTALMVNASVELFIQTCFNYPTLSEAYKYAAYDALGQLGGP